MSQEQKIKAIQEKFQNRFSVLQSELARELEGLNEPGGHQSDEGLTSFVGFLKSLKEGYSQSSLLNTLLDNLSKLAPRALMLIYKEGVLFGWSSRGFSDSFQETGSKKVKWAVKQFPELGQVIAERKMLESNYGELGEIADSISSFDDFSPVKSVFIPVMVRNKVAGVLYIDSGETMELANLEAIEMLIHVASMELTLVTTKLKKAPAPKDASPSAPSKSSSPEELTAEPEKVETEELDQDDSSAQISFETDGPAIGLPGQDGGQTAPTTPDGLSREEKKAQRVARVLVSDLILYNQDKVIEGRSRGSLYELLKEDIDRSYEHYQSRTHDIKPNKNYFKEELIDQVAEGNSGLLGEIPF